MPSIRLASADDAAAIAAIYAPYCQQSVISFEESAPTADEIAARIARIGAERPWIVLEDDAAIVGYAYAGAHHERASYRWSVSTAIYVGGGYARRGAGRALYSTLFEVLRQLGYYKATAGITLPNAASVGLHEAFGFRLVGVYRDIGFKFGGWHDVAWYQVSIQPPSRNPLPPRSIAGLHGTHEWDAAVARGMMYWKGAGASRSEQ